MEGGSGGRWAPVRKLCRGRGMLTAAYCCTCQIVVTRELLESQIYRYPAVHTLSCLTRASGSTGFWVSRSSHFFTPPLPLSIHHTSNLFLMRHALRSCYSSRCQVLDFDSSSLHAACLALALFIEMPSYLTSSSLYPCSLELVSDQKRSYD